MSVRRRPRDWRTAADALPGLCGGLADSVTRRGACHRRWAPALSSPGCS